MATDDRILKSYVWHGEQCFFVSTIERDSSAFLSPAPRYNETAVWKYDWDTSIRGEMLGLTGDGPALRQHFRVVELLRKTGKMEDEQDDS